MDRELELLLLAWRSGWLIFNTHGLDEEGWGPIRAPNAQHPLVSIPLGLHILRLECFGVTFGRNAG